MATRLVLLWALLSNLCCARFTAKTRSRELEGADWDVQRALHLESFKKSAPQAMDEEVELFNNLLAQTPSSLAEDTVSAEKKLIFVEHIMKCGGTALCSALTVPKGCDRNWKNCRPDLERDQIQKITSGIDYFAPNITKSLVNEVAANIESLCGVVFHEPGYSFKSRTSWKALLTPYENLKSPFWDAYTTVLLVRDPYTRLWSHYHQWEIGKYDQNVDHWLSGYKEFGTFELSIIKNNFITQHLVPGFRRNLTKFDTEACTPSVIEHAKKVVDKFDIVLNFKDLSKESFLIVNKKLQLNAESFNGVHRQTRVTRDGKPPILTKSQASKFRKLNRCDYSIVKYANEKIKKLARDLR